MRNKILSKTIKYKGLTLDVCNQEVKFKEYGNIEFEFIDRPEVAIIIPFLSQENILLVSQYRAAINDYILEFPAGKKKQEETIKETAIRELKEETGYLTDQIEQIGTFLVAPHFTNEKIYVFVAHNLKYMRTNREDKEIIKIKTLSLKELIKYQTDNLLLDAKTNLALTMLINLKNAKIK